MTVDKIPARMADISSFRQDYRMYKINKIRPVIALPVSAISRNCAVSVANEFLEALEVDRFVEAVITASLEDLAVKLRRNHAGHGDDGNPVQSRVRANHAS